MARESSERRDRRLSATGLAWIRLNYLVPARRGGRIRFTGNTQPRLGSITSARGAHLRVRLDGDSHPVSLHPTWCVEYEDAPSSEFPVGGQAA